MSQNVRRLVRKAIPLLAGFAGITVVILLDDFFINMILTDGEKIIIGLLFVFYFQGKQEEDGHETTKKHWRKQRDER